MEFFDEAKSSVESGRVEVRPNRTVLCRRSSIGVSNTGTDTDTDTDGLNDDGTNRVLCSSIINILFVHGSCASSSQYDDLLNALEINGNINNGNINGNKISSYPSSKINCYSYDQLGCAGSKHPSTDWEAFSSSNLLQDLQSIVQDGILPASNESSSLFVVGHSHGCSQVIQLINRLSASHRCRIKGVILMSGALKDGPGEHAKDGGHWIFKFIPISLLRKMQPSLSQSFFEAAVHPKHRETLRKNAINVSDTNDMLFCKAFYRQQVYASSEDAAKVQTRALVLHGSEDLVLPSSAGEHLHNSMPNSEFMIVSETSHQVFQEKPHEVAKAILKFVFG